MEAIVANAKKAKWVILGFVGSAYIIQKTWGTDMLLNREVFGYDGNGGHMIKILTDLTDEEIAKLKFARRLMWHMPLVRWDDHKVSKITD